MLLTRTVNRVSLVLKRSVLTTITKRIFLAKKNISSILLIFSEVFGKKLKRSNPGSFLQTRSGKSIKCEISMKILPKSKDFAMNQSLGELVLDEGSSGKTIECVAEKVVLHRAGLAKHFTGCVRCIETLQGPFGGHRAVREGKKREKSMKFGQKSMDFAMFGHWEIWFWMRGRPGKSSSCH